jgi:hypothetical protein
MLRSRSASKDAPLQQLVAYFQSLPSVAADSELATAIANLENIRKRQADVTALVGSQRQRLERAESDAADAIAAGRPYDERSVKTAHVALSSAESELRVLNLAVLRAEQQIPTCEMTARQRLLKGLRMAHEEAVKELSAKLDAAAEASRTVRLIEMEAARLLGLEDARAVGIAGASWDDVLATNNGHPTRLAEWRQHVSAQAGIPIEQLA